MAELLYQMNRHEAALESLESALRLSPQDASLHYRLAEIQRATGNLPQALVHAWQAIQDLPATADPGLASQMRLLAAELSYQMLLPGQARSYLSPVTASAGAASSAANNLPVQPTADDFRHASLSAELALDAGDEAAAAQSVAVMRRLAARHPRCLAARARLACLRGDCAVGVELFQSALQALQALEVEWPGGLGSNDEATLNLAAVCQAALDAFQWDEAQTLAQRLVERASSYPSAQVKLGQVILLRAEAQALCQDLEIRQHAAGNDALEEMARQVCEDAFQEAGRLLDDAQVSYTGMTLAARSTEDRQIIGVWLARGRAVFFPTTLYAQTLQQALKAYLPRPDFVAALVMVFRRCGDAKGAAMAAQLDWLPGYQGPGVMSHPLVLTQLALALAGDQPIAGCRSGSGCAGTPASG
jgi:tetratricopeptide (TPR) repeat protein